MSTSVLVDHVAAYANQVRVHLADLGPEQVEDLTDGLEADLVEALEDTGAQTVAPTALERLDTGGPTSIIDLTSRFGEPQDYAAELRAAAGLPAAAATGAPRGLSDRLRAGLGGLRERACALDERIAAHPGWSAVRAFLVALRPLWWVARGWMVFAMGAAVFGWAGSGVWPPSLPAQLLLLALVVVSVQYGRGVWRPRGGLAWTGTAVSVVAAVLLLPFAAVAAEQGREVYVYTEPEPVADGVYLDGASVANLFVYGADGQLIPSAQIVDDQGRSVRLDRAGDQWSGSGEANIVYSPAHDAAGREVWNVYPMAVWAASEGDWEYDESVGALVWVPRAGAAAQAPQPPLRLLTPLEGAEPELVEPDAETPQDPPSEEPAEDAPAEEVPTEPAGEGAPAADAG